MVKEGAAKRKKGESVMKEPLLEVRNLKTEIETEEGVLQVVNNINFHVNHNECFGVIGESGCGKSITAMSVMGYVDYIGATIAEGEILYEGKDLTKLTPKEWKAYRGKKLSMIMQNPQTAFNPLYTVGDQLVETIRLHRKMSKKEAWREAEKTFEYLGISAERLKAYPFQLSGGMLQRIAGGVAIAGNPGLIIADEPTTALDATIQLQYLNFMKHIQKDTGASILLISHDIKVIAMMCDRIAVMYAGRIVEEGTVRQLIESPKHPYTKALLSSANLSAKKMEYIEPIKGQPPSLYNIPNGCLFAPRCGECDEKCLKALPPKVESETDNYAYCWRLKK